jgi:hypothetical protein
MEFVPNELLHLIGEFHCEDPNETKNDSPLQQSALFFYFNVLACLSSHMYFKIHDSTFWQHHAMSIVLRNRKLLFAYGINQEQQENYGGDENQNDLEASQTQFLYLQHLIETCKFPHLKIVGWTYSTFVHDLLRVIDVSHIVSLSVTCVFLCSETILSVIGNCNQLKSLSFDFRVEKQLQSKLSTDSSKQIVNYEQIKFPYLKRISFNNSASSGKKMNSVILNFVLTRCGNSLRRIELCGVVPPAHIFKSLCNDNRFHNVKYLKIVEENGQPTLDLETFQQLGQACKQLETLHLILPYCSVEALFNIFTPNVTATLKTLVLNVQAVLQQALDLPHLSFSMLENLDVSMTHDRYSYYNQAIYACIAAYITNNCCPNNTLKTLKTTDSIIEFEQSNLNNLESLHLNQNYDTDPTVSPQITAAILKLVQNCSNLHSLLIYFTKYNSSDVTDNLLSDLLCDILKYGNHLVKLDVNLGYFTNDNIKLSSEEILMHTARYTNGNLRELNAIAYIYRQVETEQQEQIDLTQLIPLSKINTLYVSNIAPSIIPALTGLSQLTLSSINAATFSSLTKYCPQLKCITVSDFKFDTPLSIHNEMKQLRLVQLRNVEHAAIIDWLALCLGCPVATTFPHVEIRTAGIVLDLKNLDADEDELNEYSAFSKTIQQLLPKALDRLLYLKDEKNELIKRVEHYASPEYLRPLASSELQLYYMLGPELHLFKLFIQFQKSFKEEMEDDLGFLW